VLGGRPGRVASLEFTGLGEAAAAAAAIGWAPVRAAS
jgi:hypothetical protein